MIYVIGMKELHAKKGDGYVKKCDRWVTDWDVDIADCDKSNW